MRKFTKKRANVLNKQCKDCTNCQSAHLGGVSDRKIQQNEQMYSKNNANLAQTANQLIWAASRMRKFNRKRANVLKKQCKYCTNCQSAHLGRVSDAKIRQKTTNVLKKQCKYCTNCQSAHVGGVSDAKIQQKNSQLYCKNNANIGQTANQNSTKNKHMY